VLGGRCRPQSTAVERLIGNGADIATDERRTNMQRAMKQTAGHGMGGHRPESGSALILVLWVLIVLSLIVSAFAFDMHIEARITSFYRKKLKAEYLARAGVERAKMLLLKSAEVKKPDEAAEEEEPDSEWYQPALQIKNSGQITQTLTEDFDGGEVSIVIRAEQANINVNTLSEEDWEDMLHSAGVPESMWPELVDCFFDWTDDNDVHRLNGAETHDWYSTLDPPYKAKDGPLDTIDELKLIKGFTPAVLYGGIPEDAADDAEPMRGILELLTTFGDGKLDCNAASAAQLMALPLIDELTVEEILLERRGEDELDGTEDDEPFESVDDLMARVPSLDAELKKYFCTHSQIFRIAAVGRVGTEGSGFVERGILAIMHLKGKGELDVLFWREQLRM